MKNKADVWPLARGKISLGFTQENIEASKGSSFEAAGLTRSF